jgi:lambda repressor-like predicted transcriptional regulator
VRFCAGRTDSRRTICPKQRTMIVGEDAFLFMSLCPPLALLDWHSSELQGNRRAGWTLAQLTKRASSSGDSETPTLKDLGEATWASRRAVLASLREPLSRSIGHFQQVHAAAPLTGRTEISPSDYLAPQIRGSSNRLS